MRSTPLAVGVDEVRPRLVERLQVLVVEARPLAELAVPGLEAAARSPGPRTTSSTRRSDLLHLLEVGLLERRQHVRRRCGRLRRERRDPRADPLGDVRPAVHDEVDARASRRSGSPRSSPSTPSATRGSAIESNHTGSVGTLPADVDRRGRALEHVELAAGAREVGHALDGGRARADDRDSLVGEPVERCAGRVPAGVVVVPAARVERVARETTRAPGSPAAWARAADRYPVRRTAR